MHVTLRLCPDVWNLRSRRCFQVLQHAFQAGCQQFGVRIIHFSVQGNHIHLIVEAPDPAALAQAMKGLKIRMALGLKKLMDRRGPVFSDRYHQHVLKTPREAAVAVRYVLDNWKVHARREGWPIPKGVDPYCSAAPRDHGPRLVADPAWWLLCVGAERFQTKERAA